ncbi:MAG: WYL domain-containing protein, partial [Bacteroidota bacterium]
IYAHLENQKYYNGFVSEKLIAEKIEMSFLTTSIEGFARWFLIFGDHAQIILPQKLKSRVKDIISAMHKKTLNLLPPC